MRAAQQDMHVAAFLAEQRSRPESLGLDLASLLIQPVQVRRGCC